MDFVWHIASTNFIGKTELYMKLIKMTKSYCSLLTNQNSIQEETKCRLKAGNSYYSVQTLLSSRLLSKNFKIKIYKTIILPVSCMVVKHGLLH